MKTTRYDNEQDWLEDREGKVTGTGLNGIVPKSGLTKEILAAALTELGIEFIKTSKKEELEELLPLAERVRLMMSVPKKVGYYKILGSKLATSRNGENPMERGHRLEEEALDLLAEELGQPIDKSLVIWSRDDDESMSVSPDGVIDRENAVEVKCKSDGQHIEVFLTKETPEEHEHQVIQHFVVNDDLLNLYLCFYNPCMPLSCRFFYLLITRESIQEKVDLYLEYERQVLREIEQVVIDLSF